MFSRYRSDVLIVVHGLLGILFVGFPGLVFYFIVLIYTAGLLSVLNVIRKRQTILFVAYLVGFELMGRMSQSGVPHEFVKYAVTSLLLLDFMQKPRSIPAFILIYGLCLLPAIFLVDVEDFNSLRKLLSLNLSGPLCLVVSVVYFYKKPISVPELRLAFLWLLYPLATILIYLIIATPDLSEVDFGYQSNFETSIYGPNQLASMLGLGILLIGICFLLKIRLFGSHLLMLLLLGLLTFRGLLTFSRGGMLAALALLTLAFLLSIWQSAQSQRHLFRTIVVSMLSGAVFYFAFVYTNDITENALLNRYTGKVRGKQIDIEKLTSGRTSISAWDLEIFQQNVLTGVGVGMAKFHRKNAGSKTEIIAHNEFTRLLAEHGLFGLVALLILIFAPFYRFMERTMLSNRIIVVALAGFCLIFMTHSATRLAAPCLLFGMSFLDLKVFQEHIQPKPTINGRVFRQYAFPAGKSDLNA